MVITLAPGDALFWGFMAIVAGAVLWIVLQHSAGFGTADTVLRLAVIMLVSAGTFTVGFDTAAHNYLFDQTTQDVSVALASVN